MKNFNSIYESVYKECNEPLENLRKRKLREKIVVILILGIIGIIVATALKNAMFIIIFISLIIFFLAMPQKRNLYAQMFKGKVIKKFVKEYNENLEYKPLSGMPQIIYRQGRFEPYQNYYSEDLIEGILEGGYPIKMAEVLTEDETTDSDGDTTTYTVFHGLFATVDLDKKINAIMQVRRKGISFGNKNKVEMDSSEFERKFNVYSTDKIIAMQLLTSDIMQLLMDFVKENRVIPEITLERNKFYIRFATGNMFEAKLMKKALDYTTLKKYYDTINFTLTLTEKFLKNIKETEV